MHRWGSACPQKELNLVEHAYPRFLAMFGIRARGIVIHQYRFGVPMRPAKLALMLPVYFIGFLFVMLAFTELNKAFWDAQIRHLCATEAGVTIYESVNLDAAEYENLTVNINGMPSLRLEEHMSPEDQFFLSYVVTRRQKPLGVSITEFQQSIVRRSDGKVLGTRNSYSRLGGDMTTFGGSGTSFSCEDIERDFTLEFLTQTFNIQGRN